MQQIYEFKSLEGVSVSFVTHTILKLIGREASMGIYSKNQTPFNKDSYELLIGENVFNILPDVFKNVRKIYGIDVVRLSHGCKANCIILDKKDNGKFKDLSPKIFDTVYDDIIKAVLVNECMPKKKGVTDAIKIDVGAKLNVDDKTADICKTLLSIYYENLGCSGVLLDFKNSSNNGIHEIPIRTAEDIYAAFDTIWKASADMNGLFQKDLQKELANMVIWRLKLRGED